MAYVHDDDDESELDDREFPDEAADDAADGSDTEPCPFCHQPIYHQADVCPHCRNFVALDEIPARRPWWYWAGLIGALAVAVLWALFG